MNIEEIKNRILQIIQKGNVTLSTKESYDEYSAGYVNEQKFHEFRSSALSFIDKIYGKNNTYYLEFDQKVDKDTAYNTQIGIGILEAIKDEIYGGWIFTTKGLITSEIFSDFLEMAEYLLSEHYKDAAAVMIGSVLEEHLRQLCFNNSISTTLPKMDKTISKKAETLNTELVKSEVYNKLEQKSVTAWLDLRNKAAHGKYTEYIEDQVILMYQGVRDFILRNPIN